MEEESCMEDEFCDNSEDNDCDGCDGEGCPLCCINGGFYQPGTEECELCEYEAECAACGAGKR